MRWSPVSAVPCSAPILLQRCYPRPAPAPLIIIIAGHANSPAPFAILTTVITAAAAVPRPLRAQPHHHLVPIDGERDIAEQAQVVIKSSQRRRMPRAEDEEPEPSIIVPEDAHLNNDSTHTPPADANPRVPSPSVQPPYPSPIVSPPQRWSLRNAFSPLVPPPLSLHARYGLSSQTSARGIAHPRPGGRLWNPTNSTPRAPPRPRSPDLEAAQVVPVPLHHPQIGGQAATGEAAGDYPLLTLQEQRQTRQSGTGTPRGSLHVEYNSSASGSTRISLPRSVSLDVRRSTEVGGDRDKGKARQIEGNEENQATAQRKKRQSLTGPPVALKQQSEALGRQEARKKNKGKGKAREIELDMASPDLEPGMPESLRNYNPVDRSELPERRSRTSLSQHSGIGPPLSSSASSIHGSAHDVVLPGEDAEWGPSHPCYPHLNPHVPISSPLYESTRIIRIRRDWMIAGDLAPTFSGLYPEILADAGLGEGEFRRVVEDVNNQLIPTFNPYNWRNVLDALLGLVTGWIWDDLGFTYAKKRLKEVERSLEGWNREIEKQAAGGMGAKFIPLRRSGYMTLDIQIPTPHIGEVGDDSDDGKAHEGGPSQQHAEPSHT